MAAAIAEDGRLFMWGGGGEDLILGQVQSLSVPRQVAIAGNRRLTSVSFFATNLCLGPSPCTWSYGLYGVALDESGSVLAWGGGSPEGSQIYGNSPRYGGQPAPVASLAGSTFVSIRQVANYYNSSHLLRNQLGEVFRWHVTTGTWNSSCSSTCVYSFTGMQPVLLGTFSSKFSSGTFNGAGLSYSSGLFDIDGNNKPTFTPVASNGSLGTSVTVDLPGNRSAKELSGSMVLATDGTIWDISNTRWGIDQVSVPLSARPVSRFASKTSRFVIGNSGHIHRVGWGTELSGNCASRANGDDYETLSFPTRVMSTGQFGPSFTEDAFMLAIDSPNEQNFMTDSSQHIWGRDPRYVYEESGNIEGLSVRPGASVDLYAYFDSKCEDSSNLSIQWDLNDDGEYETTGTVQNVQSGTTSVTTERAANGEDGEYLGLASTYRQSKITITSSTIGGAFLQGGGRYIGVQVTSPSGSTKQRIAVIVVPKKPTGRVGVSINAAARFTNSAEVELNVVWPEGSTSMVVSNDGLFADAREIPVATNVRWNLPSSGTGLLPTTVYVRFGSIWPDSGGWSKWENEWNFTDDIVLDLSPPVVSSVSASTNDGSSVAQSMSLGEVARGMSQMLQTALVSFSALDAASGISAIQVTDDTAIPGPERAYSTQIRVPVGRGTVAVRAKDNVGHWSNWTYAKVTGFVPQAVVETPNVPVVPNIPANVPATPTAPAVEIPPAVVQSPAVATPQPATPAQVSPANTPSTSSSVATTAKLVGTTAKVSVTIPSALASTCTSKTVKGKKVQTCKPATVVVSTSTGASKTFTAKKGANALTMPKVKKGTTITVKVGGKVVSRVKVS